MSPIPSSRSFVLVGALVTAFLILEIRLIDLQVVRHAELERKAEEYQDTIRVEQSWRAQIRDRNGITLAVTIPVKDIYADLLVWTNHVELLSRVVAPYLHVDSTELSRRVRDGMAFPGGAGRSPRAELLLERDVSPVEWGAIQQALARETFGLPVNHLATWQRTELAEFRRRALFAVDDQWRYYPQGTLLAQVLGFVGTGTNGHLLEGKWGVEARYDAELAGSNGICVSSQDAAGNELAFGRIRDVRAHEGSQVVLTVDLTLQKIVEAALARMMVRYHPLSASCIVIRPSTGEILALANFPTYSPQRPDAGPVEAWCNHAISDNYEPGSVFKVITLSAALDLGVVNLNEQIFCENGRWIFGRRMLHDDASYGWLPVWECLAKSSNIGFAKIAIMVGTNQLNGYMRKFGFGRKTEVELPYETPGMLHDLADWTPLSISRVAIGQEFAVSQLQLAMAYAAIANDGVLMKPRLVRELDHPDGSPVIRYASKSAGVVIRPDTARWVREAMQYVVLVGTGTAAAVPGYSVAGKTGTAQISDGRQYLTSRFYCSFIGMVPAGKPELVIAVAVDGPKTSAFGGLVAAPVFREIAGQAMALYSVPPDKKITARAAVPGTKLNLPGVLLALIS